MDPPATTPCTARIAWTSASCSRAAPAIRPALAAQAEANPEGTARAPARKFLRDMEREQVESALIRHGWVQSRAARELGLTQRQMGYRIKKYGLRLPGEESGGSV